MLKFFPSAKQHSIIRTFLLIAVIGGFCVMRAQAQTNLALHKPAQQSSTYDSGYAAANCVDGVKSGGQPCHTQNERNPWWQVDLQGNYAVSQIVVYNRKDCCGERERTITALLSTDGQNWTRIYAHNGTDFKTLQIDGGGRAARYVRLQLAATDYMNVNEVEVYGSGSASPTPLPQPAPIPTSTGQTNLALHKPAQQSSTYDSGYAAANCVDGVKSGGQPCHTQNERNPWWQVDLQGNYAVSQIVVYNREDCCGERERTITALLSADGQNWTRIYAHNGTDFKTLQIDGGGRAARYVRLQLAATDYMNVNEVEVYGSGSASPTPLPQPSPQPAPPSGNAVHYQVENFVFNAPDMYQNPRNYHDFMIDFTTCTVRELNSESQQGREQIRILVCRDKSRLTFITTTSGSTPVEYDWVFQDGGKTIAGAYRQGGTFGPSVGGIK